MGDEGFSCSLKDPVKNLDGSATKKIIENILIKKKD